MLDTEGEGVFLGMDVGKTAHHGHGLTPAGKKVFDRPMPNSEPKLRAVFNKLKPRSFTCARRGERFGWVPGF
ncbi:transposase [Streptomyces sp. NPDC005533]|uniref:IS110 family transposase n=1 Tax=Streptomyces sp. NPDC005533 TaxID=3364723 RepID=UPI0036A2583A